MTTPSKTADQQHIANILQFNRESIERHFPSDQARSIQTVGILGAGTMGVTIAAATMAGGVSVVLTDTSEEVLATATDRILSDSFLHNMTESDRGTLEVTSDLGRIAQCDLVLETIVEDPAIKGCLYAKIEPLLHDRAILASNTSTLPISRLSSGLSYPGRFCGVHFFHPIARRTLVEVIQTDRTDTRTVATAVGFARSIQHVPLVVDDAPGFLVNRLVMVYTAEAMQLLMEGVSIDQVDRAAEAFGMVLGPIRMLDETGLKTALDCAWVFAGAYPDVVPTSPLLVDLVKAKRLGRKSGAGFFRYEDDLPPDVRPMVDPYAKERIARWTQPETNMPIESITMRLILPILLESVRILSSGSVSDPRVLDMGAVFGMGFPESRGGPLGWADSIGLGHVLELLEPLQSLGPRMQPPSMLVEMAQSGRRFHAPNH